MAQSIPRVPGINNDPGDLFGSFFAPSQGWLNGDLLGIGSGDPTLTDFAKAAGSVLGVAQGSSTVAAGAKDATPASSDFMGNISHWFVRAVVIILGFIFVGVGLSMFKQTAINVVTAATK